MKTASDDTSDMISKRQLLVDGDAEASNSAEVCSTADPFIYYENGRVDLGILRQVKCVSGVKLQSV